MKRKLFFPLLIVGILVLVSACSSTAKSNNTKTASSNQNTVSQNGSETRGRVPDFGQPKRQADIRGVVKSITGNEVAILKMDINSGGRQASSTEQKNNSENSKNSPSVSLSGAGVPGSRGGRMGGMGGPGGPGGESTTDRVAMLEELKKMSTGEDKVIIPVGIQMLKTSSNAETNKREMVEATLEDIKSDKMITIWLNNSVTDKKVAEFILIN